MLERASGPASFFEAFPRWRQLISINKAATGRGELDANLRHDWNSLLSDSSHTAAAAAADAAATSSSSSSPSCSSTSAALVLDDALRSSGLLFSSYSATYYPEADRLVDYMRDFAAGTPGARTSGGGIANATGAAAALSADNDATHPRRPLRIRYGSSVVRVSTADAGAGAGSGAGAGTARFELLLADGSRVRCRFLIVATGLQEVVPALGVNAAEALQRGWVISYSNASTNLALYRNKTVLLLGRGNAAFEFANSVLEVAASVHLLGRSGGRVRLAAETHYPGDVRSVHAHLLETYLLKSLDGMAEAPLEHILFGRDAASGRTTLEDVYSPCVADAWGRQVSRCLYKRAYDHVISCPGWRFEREALFDADVRPRLHANGKHPQLTARFESANVPGLFFAGTLMHGNDHKKSSGGFIHGFRYLVRALHRILEEQEAEDEEAAAAAAAAAAVAIAAAEGGEADATASVAPTAESPPLPPPQTPPPRLSPAPARWPRTDLRACGLRGLVSAILRRANLASGPYQMFGGLVDVFLLEPVGRYAAARFTDVGVLSALHLPWSFPAAPDCAAAAPGDVYAPLFVSRPAGAGAATGAAREDSDAAVDSALRATLFEEVPAKLAAERAAAWHAMAAGMGAGPPDYITLALEFGTGSSSHVPEGRRAQDIDITKDSAGYMKARADWARDPYSRLRANVGLHNPEASHFLHPVLRFFSAARNATHPLLELHIIEDFHIEWTHFTAHVLPLARFLQDVGGRRVATAAAEAGAAGGTAGATASTAAVWQRPAPRPSTFASLLQRLMVRPEAMLYFRGEAVRGCEGWAFSLTQQAADALFAGGAGAGQPGAGLLALHAVPAAPAPLSAQERAFTAAVRAQTRALSGGLGLFEARNASLAPARAPPQPRAQSERDERMQAGLLAHLDGAHRALTARLRGLALVLLAPRVGDAAVLAEEFGVDPSLPPTLILYGAPRAALPRTAAAAAEEGRIFGATPVLRLDGTDLAGLDAAITAAAMAGPASGGA